MQRMTVVPNVAHWPFREVTKPPENHKTQSPFPTMIGHEKGCWGRKLYQVIIVATLYSITQAQNKKRKIERNRKPRGFKMTGNAKKRRKCLLKWRFVLCLRRSRCCFPLAIVLSQIPRAYRRTHANKSIPFFPFPKANIAPP